MAAMTRRVICRCCCRQCCPGTPTSSGRKVCPPDMGFRAVRRRHGDIALTLNTMEHSARHDMSPAAFCSRVFYSLLWFLWSDIRNRLFRASIMTINSCVVTVDFLKYTACMAHFITLFASAIYFAYKQWFRWSV